jgi:hypothetical protein
MYFFFCPEKLYRERTGAKKWKLTNSLPDQSIYIIKV